jgi:hypothetical protein
MTAITIRSAPLDQLPGTVRRRVRSTLVAALAALTVLAAAPRLAAEDQAALQPAAKAVTPATIQAEIADAIKQDPSFWSDYDLDGDGAVSQVEVIVCLITHPSWMREHFPSDFAAIDTDGDHAISVPELLAFAGKIPPERLQVVARTTIHQTKDLTDQQGFEQPTARKHFDPVAGLLPRGTVLEEGAYDILVAH